MTPPTILYLVRHSKAESSHPQGDPARTLTEKGWKRLHEVTARIKDQTWEPGLRLSSPYTRALETARGFAEDLGFGGTPLEKTGSLTPDADPLGAVREIRTWASRGHKSIWVFTHNPFVTELARDLLDPSETQSLSFHTPSVYALEFRELPELRGGRILWQVHPQEFD